MSEKMSPRAVLHAELIEWIASRRDRFSAPYGVLDGLEKVPGGGPGKVRTITFGIARLLDATLYVFSPKYLLLHTSRGDWKFKNGEEFKTFMTEEFGA